MIKEYPEFESKIGLKKEKFTKEYYQQIEKENETRQFQVQPIDWIWPSKAEELEKEGKQKIMMKIQIIMKNPNKTIQIKKNHQINKQMKIKYHKIKLI